MRVKKFPRANYLQEKSMAPHSNTLAWKIPWTEEPGRLQSMGSLRVGHNWATSLSLFTFMHRRRKWQPTPVFLPGESQGRGSLVGCRLWGSHRVGQDWSDLAAAAADITQCPPVINKKNMEYPYSGILLSIKKEWSTDACYDMVEPQNIIQVKEVRYKGLHILFTWNLLNRQVKQAWLF